MDEVKVNELVVKASDEVTVNDRFVVEDEDGTKTSRLGAVQLLMSSTTIYKSFNDLKNAILNGNVVNGVLCHTLGYYKPNDNGAAAYFITADSTVDGENYKPDAQVTTSDNITYNIFLMYDNDEYVNVEQFGAHGDGVNDDSKVINSMIESGYKMRFKSSSTYVMREPITLKDNMDIDFNGATLLFKGCNGFITDEKKPLTSVTLKNLTIDVSSTIGINIDTHIDNLMLDNVTIKNYTINAIRINSANNARITNINIYGKETVPASAITYGVENIDTDIFGPITTGALYFDNINIVNACPAFNIKYSKGNTIEINNIQYRGIPNNDEPNNLILTSNEAANIFVSSIIVSNATYVVEAGSSGNISLKNITCVDCIGLINQTVRDSIIELKDSISLYSTSNLEDKLAVYGAIQGTLIQNSNIEYDDNYKLMSFIKKESEENISYEYQSENYGGTIIDSIHPSFRKETSKNYEDLIGVKDYRTLEVRSDHNTKMNISSSDKLKEIYNIDSGLHGQIIQLTSNRLIEILTGGNIKLPHLNKRIFIGIGSEKVNNDQYDIDIDNILNVIANVTFGSNLKKRVRVFVKPLTVDTMKVYIQFIDKDTENSDFGRVYDNTKREIIARINSTTYGTNQTSSVEREIKLSELEEWSINGTDTSTKFSQKIAIIDSVNVNDIESISINIDCSNIYTGDTPIGNANISIFPKNIFSDFVFYPNGILLQKSSTNIWNEI